MTGVEEEVRGKENHTAPYPYREINRLCHPRGDALTMGDVNVLPDLLRRIPWYDPT